MIDFVRMPFRPEGRPAWYRRLGYPAAVIGVGITTAALHLAQPLLSLSIIYLVYLVVVIAVAVGWGLHAAVLAALLAFLAANFFFIPPVFTFTVAAVQDLLALAIFLGLATLASQLVSRLREEAREARAGQRVTNTLYELSQTINREPDLAVLLAQVCAQLCAVLPLDACTITLRAEDGAEAVSAHGGVLLQEGKPGLVRVPLHSGLRILGMLLMRPVPGAQLTADEERLLAAFADQLQVAVERARWQQAAIDGEVLRRTDALRVSLLAAVAHDLRTPLASIKAAAGSLLSTRIQWTGAQQQQFLQAIVGESDHINQIVHNLLATSRIEAGQLRPQKEWQLIEPLINGVLERLAPRLSEHPVQTYFEPGLPGVLLDAVEIDEVLTNLLENAIKYTPAGTAIEVRVRRLADSIAVEVADDGPGIPAEHLPLLFDRFYRVTAEGSAHRQGTGLGLTIVKSLVEAHGGHVSAENKPGGGAVFRFTLPIPPQRNPARAVEMAAPILNATGSGTADFANKEAHQ